MREKKQNYCEIFVYLHVIYLLKNNICKKYVKTILANLVEIHVKRIYQVTMKLCIYIL